MNGPAQRRGLAAFLLAAGFALSAAPALAQTGTTTRPGGTGTGTGTVGGTTTTATTADPFMTEFAAALAVADSLVAEFNITFQNPWEELFLVLIIMEMRAQMAHQQQPAPTPGTTTNGVSPFGRRGSAPRVRGGFDTRPAAGGTGTGTTTGGTSTSGG